MSQSIPSLQRIGCPAPRRFHSTRCVRKCTNGRLAALCRQCFSCPAVRSISEAGRTLRRVLHRMGARVGSCGRPSHWSWCGSRTIHKEDSAMWRSLFAASGVAICILGAECMVVDRFVLAESVTRSTPYMITEEYSAWDDDLLTTAKRRILVPPEWAPWGLLSTGVMVVLYSSSFPKRSAGDN